MEETFAKGSDLNLKELKDWSSKELYAYISSWCEKHGFTFAPLMSSFTGAELVESDFYNLGAFFGEPRPGKLDYGVLVKALKRHIKPELSTLQKKFNAPYQNPDIVNHFVGYLQDCSAAFHKDKGTTHFSPYVSVVQASGYGKTRLMKETSKRLRTVYICLREQNSSGFPPRTNHACNFIYASTRVKGDAQQQEDVAQRLLAIYRVAVGLELDEVGLGQFDDVSFADADTSHHHFWPAIERNLQSLKQELNGQRVSMFLRRLLANPVENRSVGNSDLVVIVFDEARYLLEAKLPQNFIDVEENMFHALQRAAIALAFEGIQIMLVFVDTTSRVSDFPSTLHFDPSQRRSTMEIERKGKRLFHPYILRDTFDVLRKGNTQLGRLLVALLSSWDDLNLLGWKLLMAADVTKASHAGKLAMVLSRVAVNVSVQGHLGEQLVASHMATLVATSYEHDVLHVTYVSEPTLALAAAEMWNRPSNLSQYLLPTLCEALTKSQVSVGSVEEIAAQIVLLRANDMASKRLGFCTLQDFLTQLLPNGQELCNGLIPPGHEEAHVSLLQFQQTKTKVTAKMLKELAIRQAALVFEPNHPGADLVIPYRYGKDETSCILVQVKNRKQAVLSDQAMLNAETVFEDSIQCVRVFLELGTVAQARNTPTDLLELRGLNFRCLNDDALRLGLQVLLGTQSDSLALVEDSIKKSGQLTPMPDSTEALQVWPFISRRQEEDADD